MTDRAFRALIVDDEPISRQMLSMALTREGFECEVASNGNEAWSQFQLDSYDLVISDLRMPGMDGGELASHLLACADPPMVIIHTSVIDPTVAKTLIQAGVDDIIFKPADYAAFASKVEAVLARSVQRKADLPPVSPNGSSHGMTFCSEEDLTAVHGETLSLNKPGRNPEIRGYQIVRRIGCGAMGEVYEAQQTPLGRPCALKVMRAEVCAESIACSRFEREARLVAGLSHWNTVRVFDFGKTNEGRWYYAMELVNGNTIDEIVKESGPLPPSRAAHFLVQACNALEEAHSTGLIHRDLKAANIMVTGAVGLCDVVKVVDFGLAREVCSESEITILTQVGEVCGSPAYMAPEQITNNCVLDTRVDIYALGVIAYYMTTGALPFPRMTLINTLFAQVHNAVERPSLVHDAVPEDFEDIILRCLQKDRDQRFESAAKLRNCITALECYGDWTQDDATDWWEQKRSEGNSPTMPLTELVHRNADS